AHRGRLTLRSATRSWAYYRKVDKRKAHPPFCVYGAKSLEFNLRCSKLQTTTFGLVAAGHALATA
ncbi:MAG: hypothetical protein WEB07_02260, partial [Natronospirillum sp.]